MSTVGDILDKLHEFYTEGPDSLNPDEAEQAILALVSEAIGPDDRDYSHDNADEMSLKILVATSTACNELRRDIRTKLGITQ